MLSVRTLRQHPLKLRDSVCEQFLTRPGTLYGMAVLCSHTTARIGHQLHGRSQNTATKASLDLRGLSGDVVLSARPATGHVTP